MEVFDSPEAFQNLQAIFQKESDKNPYKQTLKIQIGTLDWLVLSCRKSHRQNSQGDFREKYGHAPNFPAA